MIAHTHKQHTIGFTIVELLIVIVVIGILATIVIVAYKGITNQATITVLQGDLANAANSLGQANVTNGHYPVDKASANLVDNGFVTYQYTYTAADNSYCLTASTDSIAYNISSTNTIPASGVCPGDTAPGGGGAPAGYEVATTVSGGSTSFNGYAAIEPASCPTVGGSWIKVPGNTLYDEPNGFCVQQYAAVNVGGVATSQNTGNKWTVVTQPAAQTDASAITSGAHLLTENEWMTIATNAAAQPTNWSGGAVGSGTLPTGYSTSTTHGRVSITLSNGQIIYFDTGSSSYYASTEWTCYTGPSADNCGLAVQSQPIPANAYYSDQFGNFSSYGSLPASSSYYYGDPRYANPALATYVTSARDKGLGYLRSSYSSGGTTVETFARGFWTGSSSSGLFTLYMYTTQAYAHALYGFRAAL